MDTFGQGLVTFLNGLYVTATALANPMVLAGLVCAASLAWMYVIEVKELDRSATKPEIGRH